MKDIFQKFENTNTAYSNWYSHVSSFGVGNFMNNDFTSGNKGKLPKNRIMIIYIKIVGTLKQLFLCQ